MKVLLHYGDHIEEHDAACYSASCNNVSPNYKPPDDICVSRGLCKEYFFFTNIADGMPMYHLEGELGM